MESIAAWRNPDEASEFQRFCANFDAVFNTVIAAGCE